MKNMAYAEICGKLEKSIIIDGKNAKYGIIFITVDKKRGIELNIWQGIYKSNCIPVFIWGQDEHDKLLHLPNEEKLWIVGRLEILDDALLEDISPYINLTDLKESGNIVISVRGKNKILTVSKDLPVISWLSISYNQ